MLIRLFVKRQLFFVHLALTVLTHPLPLVQGDSVRYISTRKLRVSLPSPKEEDFLVARGWLAEAPFVLFEWLPVIRNIRKGVSLRWVKQCYGWPA